MEGIKQNERVFGDRFSCMVFSECMCYDRGDVKCFSCYACWYCRLRSLRNCWNWTNKPKRLTGSRQAFSFCRPWYIYIYITVGGFSYMLIRARIGVLSAFCAVGIYLYYKRMKTPWRGCKCEIQPYTRRTTWDHAKRHAVREREAPPRGTRRLDQSRKAESDPLTERGSLFFCAPVKVGKVGKVAKVESCQSRQSRQSR